jgi:hypothetical protein
MYACPSCSSSSIAFVAKWLSSSAAPAECHTCGKQCAIAIVDASGTVAASALLITACGFIAVALHSVFPLLTGVVLAVAFYFWRQHKAPLFAVTQAEAQNAKRSAWLSCLMMLFPSMFS